MGIRILVIDDVVCARTIVKRGLETAGHTTFDTGRIDEALAILKKETIDLIIIDLNMTNADGFEIYYRTVKALNMPSFTMTSIIDSNQIKKAVSCGFKEVLRKPLDVKHVNTLIEKHCVTANRMIKVEAKLPQAVFDAVQSAAQKANLPVEDFLSDAFVKLFTPQMPVPAQVAAPAAAAQARPESVKQAVA